MNGNFFVPIEKLKDYMKNGAMNSQEGVQIMGTAAPSAAKLLPPPLTLADLENPMFYAYVENIREPTFCPWYMEGGLGVMAKYGEYTGLYFLSIMLSGPGAFAGMWSGREISGLPKKVCERISVSRVDDMAHCFIERGGVRLLDVELKMGGYDEPSYKMGQEGASRENPITTRGGCLLHKYTMDGLDFTDMEMIYYDSQTRYYSWEPCSAALKINSSIDDPWGALEIKNVLAAGWMVSDNWASYSRVYSYADEEAAVAMQHLYYGRYDRCMISSAHQKYE
ncbi:acetoacetate decarboxylase family protein [Cloacibacillus evryensis]|uniref:acetoacetate decarboxylase family protein n=1 Tax=Cloacibacillus evryensis TaxID=508460 RepID=UPI003AB37642